MAKLLFDLGHGGSDPGAVNGNRKEKNDVHIALTAVSYTHLMCIRDSCNSNATSYVRFAISITTIVNIDC